MLLASTLVLLGMARGGWSLIYGINRLDEVVIPKLPLARSVLETEQFEDVLHYAGLSSRELHFDRVKDVLEVLVLPDYFFAEELTTEQTVQMLLNPALVALQLPKDKFVGTVMDTDVGRRREGSGEAVGTNTNVRLSLSKSTVAAHQKHRLQFFGSISDSIADKLNSFHSALSRVTPRAIPSPQHQDAIIKTLQPSALSYISPLLAFVSPAFQVTYKNIARLLGVSLHALRATRTALPYVMTAIRMIYRLVRQGRDAFTLSNVLLTLAEQLPSLDPVTGQRIVHLVHDLNDVMAGIVIQEQQAAKALVRFTKHSA